MLPESIGLELNLEQDVVLQVLLIANCHRKQLLPLTIAMELIWAQKESVWLATGLNQQLKFHHKCWFVIVLFTRQANEIKELMAGLKFKVDPSKVYDKWYSRHTNYIKIAKGRQEAKAQRFVDFFQLCSTSWGLDSVGDEKVEDLTGTAHRLLSVDSSGKRQTD